METTKFFSVVIQLLCVIAVSACKELPKPDKPQQGSMELPDSEWVKKYPLGGVGATGILSRIPADIAMQKTQYFADHYYTKTPDSTHNPVYIEFTLDDWYEFYNAVNLKYNASRGSKNKVVRIYFAADPETKKMTVVLSGALRADDNQPFTDHDDLYWNLGTPCPDDCQNGRFDSNYSNAPQKGAMNAYRGYTNHYDYIRCLFRDYQAADCE